MAKERTCLLCGAGTNYSVFLRGVQSLLTEHGECSIDCYSEDVSLKDWVDYAQEFGLAIVDAEKIPERGILRVFIRKDNHGHSTMSTKGTEILAEEKDKKIGIV